MDEDVEYVDVDEDVEDVDVGEDVEDVDDGPGQEVDKDVEDVDDGPGQEVDEDAIIEEPQSEETISSRLRRPSIGVARSPFKLYLKSSNNKNYLTFCLLFRTQSCRTSRSSSGHG